MNSTVLRPSLALFSLLAGNACSYDPQTVLEMLFDIDTDNGINNNRIRGENKRDLNHDSCFDICAYKYRGYKDTDIISAVNCH